MTRVIIYRKDGNISIHERWDRVFINTKNRRISFFYGDGSYSYTFKDPVDAVMDCFMDPDCGVINLEEE